MRLPSWSCLRRLHQVGLAFPTTNSATDAFHDELTQGVRFSHDNGRRGYALFGQLHLILRKNVDVSVRHPQSTRKKFLKSRPAARLSHHHQLRPLRNPLANPLANPGPSIICRPCETPLYFTQISKKRKKKKEKRICRDGDRQWSWPIYLSSRSSNLSFHFVHSFLSFFVHDMVDSVHGKLRFVAIF